MITVYPDRAGLRWWTKAWFNNKADGEAAVEITDRIAFHFMEDSIGKDVMLEEYFPDQMRVYHQAIEQTREQLITQLGEQKQNREQQLNL